MIFALTFLIILFVLISNKPRHGSIKGPMVSSGGKGFIQQEMEDAYYEMTKDYEEGREAQLMTMKELMENKPGRTVRWSKEKREFI